MRGDPPGTPIGAVAEHVLRAQAGDAGSLTWLVVYFSPLLYAQAQYRLRGVARNDCDPDDLVDETWAVALPRITDLRAEPAHLGQVLLGFLSTTLLHKALALRARRSRRPLGASERVPPSSAPAGLEGLVDELGSVSATVRSMEEQEELYAALAALDEEDREVVVLRGLEQRSNEEVAGLVGLTPAGASRRYQRALERLRQRMPASLFEGLLGA